MRHRWRILYAARFVAKWEGYLSHAYQDSGGIWTIGYGHTGSDVYPGLAITKVRALKLLAQDLRTAAQCVNRNFKRKLTIRQRIAAISFTFNVGCGGLESSTFLKEANRHNDRSAGEALMLWVKDASGSTLLGLQRRRAAEKFIFLHQGKNARKVPRSGPRAKAHS